MVNMLVIALFLVTIATISLEAEGQAPQWIESDETNGYWGSWGKEAKCPPNQFVYGFRLKSEETQGSGDDTALNGIVLICYTLDDLTSSRKEIESKNGKWGTWSADKMCTEKDGPIVGFQMQIEEKQGRGDDTAANNIKFKCLKNTAFIEAHANTNFGTWRPALYCPAWKAVVGIQTRVEGPGGDDTSLNGVRLLCKTYFKGKRNCGRTEAHHCGSCQQFYNGWNPSSWCAGDCEWCGNHCEEKETKCSADDFHFKTDKGLRKAKKFYKNGFTFRGYGYYDEKYTYKNVGYMPLESCIQRCGKLHKDDSGWNDLFYKISAGTCGCVKSGYGHHANTNYLHYHYESGIRPTSW